MERVRALQQVRNRCLLLKLFIGRNEVLLVLSKTCFHGNDTDLTHGASKIMQML